MSTIKSSGENLKLSSDNTKDIELQHNGSTKVTVKSDGNVEMGGQLQVSGGALSAPSFSFVGDTNTGISRPTADAVNIVTGGAERMRIDTAGQVTMPYQPSFCVRGFSGYNTNNIMYWSVDPVNVGSHMNINSGVFTAPVSGVYSFSFNTGHKASAQWMVLYLYINGVEYYQCWSMNSNQYNTQGGTVLASLSANDTVDLRVGVSSSYSLPQTSSVAFSNFSGHLVG